MIASTGGRDSVEPGSTSAPYAEELVAHARADRLHADPVWHSLLHYKPALLGGYKSLVDDPNFFLAPNGKTDPGAELDATLRGFFQQPTTNTLEHPICRFVARYTWLRERLAIDTNRLPLAGCERFEAVRNYLGVDSVTLVFPAAYMNGPASMFGHTLLVFDAEGQNRLLSRAVSYAAKADTRFGPLFAFAGIMGLYPGYYAIQPYWEKVEQYGDIGHRDVWEYQLNLSSNDVDRALRHAWELQSIWSRYYFFGENCAYNLYFLLEAARPDLRLSDTRDWFVIPVDTVKAIDRKGLVEAVHYRPSQVTRIHHLADQLDEDARAFARDVARGRRPAGEATEAFANPTNRAMVLQLASEYMQYLFTEEQLPRHTYNARVTETLRVRSKLPRLPDAVTAIPAPPRPDRGHGPNRVSAGFGTRENDSFASLRGRIAYHALLDNDAGFEKGAEIQFLSTEARYVFERDALLLQKLDVVHVESVSPRDEFFKPASWKFAAGVEQADRVPDRDRLVLQAQTGAGLSREGRGTLGWGWIEARGLGGPSLGGADYAVGTGPAAGLMTTIGDDWKHVIEVRATWFGLGEQFWDYAATWGQDFRLTPDNSLSLELTAAKRDENAYQEAHLRWNLYF